MYSFYRAWLMRDAVSATLATPPDILINVGGHHLPPMHTATSKYHQFAAHRHVVSAHSGYLKALLTTTPGQSVSVPNIGPEAFGPLLTYMYTGYLDVNVDNIYSILLATHLLHMPRALDHCRAFLIQNQQQSLASLHPGVNNDFLSTHGLNPPSEMSDKHPRDDLPTLVKPIPSRKMLPVLFNPVPPVNTNYWPHLSYPLPPPPTMMSSSHSPFKTIAPTVTETHEPNQLRESYAVEERTPSRKRPRSPLAVPSTSRRTVLLRVKSPVRSSSVSPCRSNSSLDSDQLDVNLSSEETQPNKHRRPLKSSAPKRTEQNVDSVSVDRGKVIIDVACCDGPVRFHRVLNDNYGFAVDEIVVGNETPENVGITSMRKELAVRRSALANNNSIPKKIPKPSVNPVSTRVEDSTVDHLHDKEDCAGVSQAENKSHISETFGEVPVTECLPAPSRHDANRPTPSEIVTSEDTAIPPCVVNQPEITHQDRPEAPITYQQLGGFINIDTTENAIVQSEYESNAHVSASSSNQSASDVPTAQATTSDHQSGASKLPSPSKPGPDGSIYTCVYCNHTFKSHYCYQKHARRHINPVTLDMSHLAVANKTAGCGHKTPEKPAAAGVRREVRLLDMNVQYYPCKTCGSKFPSYYFVHKHRKMCHADEADEITASEESQTHSQSTTINSV